MITSGLLQNSCDSPSARKSTNIPTIIQDFLESFGFSTYSFNNAIRVASDKIFFRRIGAHFGEASF
jgi:hypothetical protein